MPSISPSQAPSETLSAPPSSIPAPSNGPTATPTLSPTQSPTNNSNRGVPPGPGTQDGGNNNDNGLDIGLIAGLTSGAVAVCGLAIYAWRRRAAAADEYTRWQFGRFLGGLEVEETKSNQLPAAVNVFRPMGQADVQSLGRFMHNFNKSAMKKQGTIDFLVQHHVLWKLTADNFLTVRLATQEDTQVTVNGKLTSAKVEVLKQILMPIAAIDSQLVLNSSQNVEAEIMKSLKIIHRACNFGLDTHEYELMDTLMWQSLRLLTHKIKDPDTVISSSLAVPFWGGLTEILSITLRLICQDSKRELFEIRSSKRGLASHRLISKAAELTNLSQIEHALEKGAKVGGSPEAQSDALSRKNALAAYKLVFNSLRNVSLDAKRSIERKRRFGGNTNDKKKAEFFNMDSNYMINLKHSLAKTPDFKGKMPEIESALTTSFSKAEDAVIFTVTPRNSMRGLDRKTWQENPSAYESDTSFIDIKDLDIMSIYEDMKDSKTKISRPSTPQPQKNTTTEKGLPEGWRSAVDPKRNKKFYYHTSGKRTWRKPVASGSPGTNSRPQSPSSFVNLSPRSIPPHASGKRSLRSPRVGDPSPRRGQRYCPNESEVSSDGLPPGWYSALDSKRGRRYYFHPATGKRVWKKPKVAEKKGSSSAFDSPVTPMSNEATSSTSESKEDTDITPPDASISESKEDADITPPLREAPVPEASSQERSTRGPIEDNDEFTSL